MSELLIIAGIVLVFLGIVYACNNIPTSSIEPWNRDYQNYGSE